MKEDGVHHGEDRGIGPDAQRQRDHRDNGKCRGLAKSAQRVTDVLGNIVHVGGSPSPGLLRDAWQARLLARAPAESSILRLLGAGGLLSTDHLTPAPRLAALSSRTPPCLGGQGLS